MLSLWKKKDKIIRTLSCKWGGAEECEESFLTKCQIKVTQPNCWKKNCCKYGVKGDITRKIECHFTSKTEHCKSVFFKKCKTVKTKHGCTRVKCCEFEKKRIKSFKTQM